MDRLCENCGSKLLSTGECSNFNCSNKLPVSISDYLDMVTIDILRRCTGKIAMKGGFALTKMLGNPRMTKDVDFSIEDAKDYEDIKCILSDIGEDLISKSVISRYVLKDKITETSSGGVIYYALDGSIYFGVDIGLHQLRYGIQGVKLSFGDCNMFTPERMLADKITAILSNKRFRRVKDIYDLYCIVNSFNISFTELNLLLDMRIGENKELWNNIPFSETVVVEYGKAYEKLDIRSMSTNQFIIKADFFEVMRMFNVFISPFKYLKGDYKIWNSTSHSWV